MAHPRIAGRLGRVLSQSADKLPARPRGDQGQSGNCTAASTSLSAFTACESLGTPLGFVPSQRELYAATRARERAAVTPPGSQLPELQDTGADLEDVFAVMADFGVCPMLVDRSPDGRFSDIWGPIDGSAPSNLNDDPALFDLEGAASVLVKLAVAAHVIPPTDPNASDLMAAALDADPPLPIEACGFVDTTFMHLAPGQVAGAPDTADVDGGGHAFWISAYRTNARGEREWKLENSWGDGWCEDGACWVSMAFVRALWGMWVMDVTVRKVTS
jgi:hypothetical protein